MQGSDIEEGSFEELMEGRPTPEPSKPKKTAFKPPPPAPGSFEEMMEGEPPEERPPPTREVPPFREEPERRVPPRTTRDFDEAVDPFKPSSPFTSTDAPPPDLTPQQKMYPHVPFKRYFEPAEKVVGKAERGIGKRISGLFPTPPKEEPKLTWGGAPIEHPLGFVPGKTAFQTIALTPVATVGFAAVTAPKYVGATIMESYKKTTKKEVALMVAGGPLLGLHPFVKAGRFIKKAPETTGAAILGTTLAYQAVKDMPSQQRAEFITGFGVAVGLGYVGAKAIPKGVRAVKPKKVVSLVMRDTETGLLTFPQEDVFIPKGLYEKVPIFRSTKPSKTIQAPYRTMELVKAKGKVPIAESFERSLISTPDKGKLAPIKYTKTVLEPTVKKAPIRLHTDYYDYKGTTVIGVKKVGTTKLEPGLYTPVKTTRIVPGLSPEVAKKWGIDIIGGKSKVIQEGAVLQEITTITKKPQLFEHTPTPKGPQKVIYATPKISDLSLLEELEYGVSSRSFGGGKLFPGMVDSRPKLKQDPLLSITTGIGSLSIQREGIVFIQDVGVTPRVTPRVIPKITPRTTPKITPRVTPKLKPKKKPMPFIPGITDVPETTPKITPIITPSITPDTTEEEITIPITTPIITPIQTPAPRPLPRTPLTTLPSWTISKPTKTRRITGKKFVLVKAKRDVTPLADLVSVITTEMITGKKARHKKPTKEVKEEFLKGLKTKPFFFTFPTVEMAKGFKGKGKTKKMRLI